MNIIAAVDENWGIGHSGKLLASIPEDMKFFSRMTTGKIVVMGHATLKSLPNSAPLKNRTNIVLSKNRNLTIKGAVVYNEKNQLLIILKIAAIKSLCHRRRKNIQAFTAILYKGIYYKNFQKLSRRQVFPRFGQSA